MMRMHSNRKWSIAIASAAIVLACGGAVMAQGNDDNRKPPTAADFIKRLDKDGDGKVSKAEFDGPAEHFTQSDANEDGYISEDEAPIGPPPGQRGQGRGNRDGGDKESR